MTKIIKNTLVYTIGNFFTLAAGFILLPIYTQYLDPSEYGIISSLEILKTVFIIFATLNIHKSLLRLYWDYKTDKEQKDFLGTTFLSISFVAILTLLLIFIFRNYVERIFDTIDFYPYYFYIIVSSFFTVFTYFPLLYLRLKEKANLFLVFSISQYLLAASLILYFIIYKQEGAEGYLKGQMLAGAVFFVIYTIFSFRIINLRFKLSVFRNIIVFTLPLIPPMIVTWIVRQSNVIFIERYLDFAEVGIFSLSVRIASLLTVITTSVLMAYEPVFYQLAIKGDSDVNRNKLSNYNQAYIIIALFLSFIIALFSKDLILLMFNEKYADVYIYIPLLTIGYCVGQISGLTGFFVKQSKKTMAIMYISFSTGVMSVILNFTLIPLWGLYGAASAVTLIFIYSFSATYIYAKKKCFFIPFNWRIILSIFLLFLIIFLFLSYITRDLYIIYSIMIKMLVMTSLLIAFYLKYKIVIFGFIGVKKNKQKIPS